MINGSVSVEFLVNKLLMDLMIEQKLWKHVALCNICLLIFVLKFWYNDEEPQPFLMNPTPYFYPINYLFPSWTFNVDVAQYTWYNCINQV